MADQNRDIVKAIGEADWEALLPPLVAYAERRLRRVGWIHGDDLQPSSIAVQDVVNIAIERCLTGKRKWTETGPEDLEVFLKGVIKSVVWSTKKAVLRSRTEPAEDAGIDCADDAPLADEVMAEAGRCDVLAATAACAEGDPDLEAYYLTVLDDGTKRAGVAEALGWEPARVSAARNKLQRRVVARFPDEFQKYKRRRAAS